MIRKRSLQVWLGLAALAVLAPMANADTLNVTLNNANVTVVEGTATALQFFGTVTNPSLSDTVYLNGDMLNGALQLCPATGPICVDDSTIVSWPLFFGPSTPTTPSSYNFDIFNVDVAANLAPGTYSGIFSILGGPDGGTATSFDDLADISFSVTVSAPAPTPEPGTLVFLLSALSVGLLFSLRVKLLGV